MGQGEDITQVLCILPVAGAIQLVEVITAQPVFIPHYNTAAQAKIPGIKYIQVKNIVIGIVVRGSQIKPFRPVTIQLGIVQIGIV